MIIAYLNRTLRCLLFLMGCAALSVLASHNSIASSPFDGVYTGQRTNTRGSNMTGTPCGVDGRISVTVQDAQFTYVHNRQNHVVVDLSVAADGSFSGSQMWGKGLQVRVTGKITGDTLDAEADSSDCHSHLSLKKKT